MTAPIREHNPIDNTLRVMNNTQKRCMQIMLKTNWIVYRLKFPNQRIF